MKKILLLCFLVLTCNLAYAYPPGAIQDLGNGVYAGETKTADGETIYFGCELIDASNIEDWYHYFHQLNDCELLHKLRKGLKKEKVIAISRTRFGVEGFGNILHINNYATYASQKPVVGRFNFKHPKDKNYLNSDTQKRSILTRDEFTENYGDIIMSVGTIFFTPDRVHVMDRRTFENRGIFRNPLSIINGGYYNISLQLHGFSALVAKYKSKDTIFMEVSAAAGMQNIIMKSLKLEDIYVGYRRGSLDYSNPGVEHINPGLSSSEKNCLNNHTCDGEWGGFDTNNLIKVDALIECYLGTYKK